MYLCLYLCESMSVYNVPCLCVIIPETAKTSSFRISAMLLFHDKIGLKTGLTLLVFYRDGENVVCLFISTFLSIVY